MSNVFKCPHCYCSYNKDVHLPISLACGDVLCLPCISSLMSESKEIKCPVDGKCLSVDLNSVITCKAILDFLPNKESKADLFYCKKHPHKKVKYSCETDSTAFCSLCVVNHKKHQINAFYPSKQKVTNQITTLLYAVEEKKQTLSKQKNLLDQCKTSLTQMLKEQLNYIQRSTDKIVNEIMRQSHVFQEQLKEKYQIRQVNIKRFLTENSNQINWVTKIDNEVRSYLDTLKTQAIIVYDDIFETKRTILKEWEDFLYKYNLTKIDVNKKHLLKEESFSIDIKHIINAGNFFNFTIDKSSDNNKENTPLTVRESIKTTQMSTNITNDNTIKHSLKFLIKKDNKLK